MQTALLVRRVGRGPSGAQASAHLPSGARPFMDLDTRRQEKGKGSGEPNAVAPAGLRPPRSAPPAYYQPTFGGVRGAGE